MVPVLASVILLLGVVQLLVPGAGQDPSPDDRGMGKTANGGLIYALQIDFDNSTYRTEWPIEWWIKDSFGVTNNGSQPMTVDFNATVLETGVEISPYPQPFHLYLDPGESQRMIYMLDLTWAGLTSDDMNIEQNITRVVRFTFWVQGNASDSRSVYIPHEIKVVPRTWLESNPNAVIRGNITAPTGKPLQSVAVQLHGVNLEYNTLTNETGFYNIPFHAHRYMMTNETETYSLVVRESGFEAYMRPVVAVPGDSITDEIVLSKARETATLSLSSRTDTNMTVFRGAVSADERYAVFSHGHGELGLSQEEIANRSSVMLFDAWTGQMLWRYYAGGEVWGADISDDGEFVAATVIQPAPLSYAVLLDRAGNEVWNTTSMGEMGSREIRISHDGNAVAWGVGDGYLNLLNRSDRSVLWSTFLEGQIRQIDFSNDDSLVYAGSGDGYLYALDRATGNISWRADIEAWPFSTGGMALSDDGSLIATASKMGNISLVDMASHSTLWSFDSMGGAHFAAVSPRNDYVLAGSGGVYSLALFGIDGTPRWFDRESSAGAIFSDNVHMAVGRDWGLDILNPNGTILASYWEDMSAIGNPVYSHFVYVSKNCSRVIVGHGSGSVYFWNVSFAAIPGSEDSTAPVTMDDYDGLWRQSDFMVNLSATDAGTGVAETYYRVNGGPLMSLSADGHPLIHTEGANNVLEYWSVDNSSNEEWPHHLLSGMRLDVTDPVANAGPDQTVPFGSLVQMDASGSSDNFGIVNYSWTFTYNGSTIQLFGQTAEFQFDIPGTYVLALVVADASGRTRSDQVTVDVEGIPIPELTGTLVPVIVLAGAATVLFVRRRAASER